MGGINIQFSALQDRYRNAMPEKRAALEQVWCRMRANPEDSEGLQQFFSLVHRLAGSASSYGFEQLGDVALSVHDTLDRHRVRSEQIDQARFFALVQELEPQMDSLLRALEREAEGIPS